MTATILELISKQQIKLSKSDRKLSAIILQSPKSVIHYSIASLAKSAGVSEPTVNRFCHKLGCAGYPDFKLRLAQELSSTGQLFHANMEANDDSSIVIRKIANAIEQNLALLLKSIDAQILEQAGEAIAQCKIVNFFGMGASSSVALDAQHKFFRFGIPVIAHTDYINQRMICSMMHPQDVAVFISYTGRTSAMVTNAQLAKQRGTTTVGITTAGSPLSQHCDFVLNAVTAEDTDLFTPMTSRIMHLAVVDMLATMVALKMGSDVENNIKEIKLSLATTRD